MNYYKWVNWGLGFEYLVLLWLVSDVQDLGDSACFSYIDYNYLWPFVIHLGKNGFVLVLMDYLDSNLKVFVLPSNHFNELLAVVLLH